MRLGIFVGSVAVVGAVIVVAQLNAGGDLGQTTEQPRRNVAGTPLSASIAPCEPRYHALRLD